jgi:hypothetical protein
VLRSREQVETNAAVGRVVGTFQDAAFEDDVPDSLAPPKSHHPVPREYPGDWTKPGLVHVCHLMHHLGYSHSGLYDAVIRGRVPRRDGTIGRRPFWYTHTIAPLLGIRPSSTE